MKVTAALAPWPLVLLSAVLATASTVNGSAASGPTPAPDRLAPPVPLHLSGVKVGGFWRQQIKLQTEKWLPHCVRQMEANGEGRELLNLIETAKALRGENHEPFHGLPWADAYVYNTIEAICLALEVDAAGDETWAAAQAFLRGKLEAWIPIVLAAQEQDGYIHSFHVLNKKPRYTRIGDHEFYVMGYLLEAGVAHHRLTQGRDRRLYDAAKRCADHLETVFGPAPKRSWKNGHPGLELALCRLGERVNESEGAGMGDRYIALARHFLDHQHKIEPREYDQSEQPAVRMSEARGHAVRATYFYSAMADIARLQHDAAYRDAGDRIWANAIHRKHYLTGGVGASAKGEAFAADYELPNNGYCESCASCGLSFWADRQHRIHADAHYRDVQERVWYNNLLGSVELGGERFYYQNPLASDKARHSWHRCPCCVGNIPRTLIAIKDQMVATTAGRDLLYVNHPVECEAVLPDIGGGALKLRQETQYPWDGRVLLTLSPARSTTFTLALRIPDRTESELYRAEPARDQDFTLSVNGTPVANAPVRQGYALVTRSWLAGDRVQLVLPVEVQRVRCDPKVSGNRGRVALQRGPLVYSFEDVDQTRPVEQLLLTPDIAFKAVWRGDLLGGVMVLQGGGLTAIPNYARLNRGGYSQVWMRERSDAAPLPKEPQPAKPASKTKSPQ
jgi:DUF1680 family protein